MSGLFKFYYSKFTKLNNFNTGLWEKLEDKISKWALGFNGLDVVTGPIFKEKPGIIGVDEVTVPGYYYKVLYSEKKKIMIGLILPNASSSKSLDQFVVLVDEIETQTGIDFFPGLEDKVKNQLEGSVNTSGWSF